MTVTVNISPFQNNTYLDDHTQLTYMYDMTPWLKTILILQLTPSNSNPW